MLLRCVKLGNAFGPFFEHIGEFLPGSLLSYSILNELLCAWLEVCGANTGPRTQPRACIDGSHVVTEGTTEQEVDDELSKSHDLLVHHPHFVGALHLDKSDRVGQKLNLIVQAILAHKPELRLLGAQCATIAPATQSSS